MTGGTPVMDGLPGGKGAPISSKNRSIIWMNAVKAIISQPFRNGLYHLFMVIIFGDLGDGFFYCPNHINGKPRCGTLKSFMFFKHFL